MKARLGPGPQRGGIAAGLTGTLVVHVAAVALLWSSVSAVDTGPPVYAVELVAAPTPPEVRKPAPQVAERPPAPEPAPTRTVPKPAPAPPRPRPTTTKPTEPSPTPPPANEPLPGETPSTGTDVATVSIPGIEFPYPEYLRNIVQEVYRRWQRPLGNTALKAEVSFLILRDGKVREIRLTSSSGSFSFDLGAQGAIEAAGSTGAFGPLPEGYPADVLPVAFYFTPRTK